DALFRLTAECDQPIAHGERALLVSLHCDTKIGELARQRLEDIQRQLEALRLFRVDRKVYVFLRRDLSQVKKPGEKFVENPLALRFLESGMQRGELDRDRVWRRGSQDRALVELEVALGVLGGARRLAQHVEREAVRPARLRGFGCLLDRL